MSNEITDIDLNRVSRDARIPSKKHIVYALVDPHNNELRYVGKSSRGMKRPRKHLTACGRRGDTHRHCWLKQMFKDEGTVPSIIVLCECETEVEALAWEVQFIALFRTAGFRLTNLTDGGEGMSGYKVSDETKRKLAEFNKGHKHSDEHKRKIAEGIKGRVRTDEHKQRISEAQKGSEKCATHLHKVQEANKGSKRSYESRCKMSEAGKRRGSPSAETRRKISESSRNMSVETRRKISESLKETIKNKKRNNNNGTTVNH